MVLACEKNGWEWGGEEIRNRGKLGRKYLTPEFLDAARPIWISDGPITNH